MKYLWKNEFSCNQQSFVPVQWFSDVYISMMINKYETIFNSRRVDTRLTTMNDITVVMPVDNHPDDTFNYQGNVKFNTSDCDRV